MSDWVAFLGERLGQEPLALVTVLATEGSAPRGAGTRMVVTETGLFGTIGGGALEHRAIEQARAILGLPPGSWRVQDWPLGPLLGQCCGGRVRLLLEHCDPAQGAWLAQSEENPFLITRLEEGHVVRSMAEKARPASLSARGDKPQVGSEFAEMLREWKRPLYLFGAGHVGQAVVRHGEGLPVQLCWFDTRPEMAHLPGMTLVEESQAEACLLDAPDEAAIAIMTHDHGLDYRLTAAALKLPHAAFVGVIGSATKKARFHSRLRKDGFDDAARARMICPIGLPGIKGKQPDVIALALLAQVLMLEGDNP